MKEPCQQATEAWLCRKGHSMLIQSLAQTGFTARLQATHFCKLPHNLPALERATFQYCRQQSICRQISQLLSKLQQITLSLCGHLQSLHMHCVDSHEDVPNMAVPRCKHTGVVNPLRHPPLPPTRMQVHLVPRLLLALGPRYPAELLESQTRAPRQPPGFDLTTQV